MSGEDTETALENQDLTSSQDNGIFDDILNNLLPENKPIDYVVGGEGTLQNVTNKDLSPELYSTESNKAESPKEVSCENSTDISSELSVNIITIQHYEAATEQAPSNITQREIEVFDTVIEVDQFSPSTPTTERNIPMNHPSTATAQVAGVNQDTHSEKNMPME
ncbi:hypothetical protein JTB14_024676 [Gonioctena quinquepunctata]|nr:hypothetical protein JTB14_024676 [Gonioctena quinquepunctata]